MARLLLFALSAALLVGCGGGQGHDHGRDVGGLWVRATHDERAAAANLVVATRRGIDRFRDVEVARREGYYQPRPGAAHFRNDAYLDDGVALDPQRPESLVYRLEADGRHLLLGAMFKLLPGQQVPPLGGDLTSWHDHGKSVRMLHVFVFDGVVDPFAASLEGAMHGERA